MSNGNQVQQVQQPGALAGTENKVVWVRVAAAGAVVVGLALAAPVIWFAVKAGIGLAALGLIALVGAGTVMSLPLLAQKFENKLLAARKAEARKNPIEELQRFFSAKRLRVQMFRDAVIAVGAQVKSLEDMVEERLREKPGYDAGKQVKSIKAMASAHAQLVAKYQNAEAAIKQLEDVIEDKKFEWNFGQAGQAAIRSLNATSGQDLLNEMLADEAFSSVRDNFNRVFAELEIEAAKLTEAKKLDFDDGMSLDLSAISIPMESKVMVAR